MTDKEHSGTREDLAESLEQLDIAKETVSQDSSADGQVWRSFRPLHKLHFPDGVFELFLFVLRSAAAPETANEPENCGGCTSNSVDADHLVDHALRDALSRNKHRESGEAQLDREGWHRIVPVHVA